MNGSNDKEGLSGAKAHGLAIPTEVLQLVIETISKNEKATDLSQKAIVEIATEAIQEGALDDEAWLEEKLLKLTKIDTIGNENASTGNQSFEDQLAKIKISEPCLIQSQEELDNVIQQHEIWIESVLSVKGEVVGSRANFEGMTISGFDFTGANLSCANFKSSTAIGAKFNGANLSKANFELANLSGSDFSNAKLRKVNFKDADLTEIETLDADLKGANFEGTALERTNKDSEQSKESLYSNQVDPFTMI